MMTFRKLAAASTGRLIRAYFTENKPEADPEAQPVFGPALDSGRRLTSYYTRRDGRATWRPDMPAAVAAAMGIDPTKLPKDAKLDRLFEAKRADTGEAWSVHQRKVSAYDLTVAPHKSVTLAAEFASAPAEAALIWNAIDRANDANMRYVAREIGWARKGHGGDEGAEPGAVGWVSFRHHNARPTLQVQDGPTGTTYLADVPVPGDPHAHIHNGFFNIVVTADGRVGVLLMVAPGCRAAEPAVVPPADVDIRNQLTRNNAADSIGMAAMLEDGTILLQLRAKALGALGNVLLQYAPIDPHYVNGARPPFHAAPRWNRRRAAFQMTWHSAATA